MQDADPAGEGPDGRRPGEEGHVAEGCGGADASGRVLRVVGGRAHSDRETQGYAEPHQHRPGYGDREIAAEANQELFIFRKDDDGAWRIARYSFSPTNPPAIGKMARGFASDRVLNH